MTNCDATVSAVRSKVTPTTSLQRLRMCPPALLGTVTFLDVLLINLLVRPKDDTIKIHDQKTFHGTRNGDGPSGLD